MAMEPVTVRPRSWSWSRVAIAGLAGLAIPPLLMIIGISWTREAARQHVVRLGGVIVTTHGGPAWLQRWLAGRSLDLFELATVVNLSDTDTHDADLVWLRRLQRIERLNLSGTPITDAGMTSLSSLSRLKALDLSRTKVTGAGLTKLQGLSSLEYLYLSGLRVTTADLTQLDKLTSLHTLDLTGTGITSPAAILRFRATHPGATVLIDQPLP